nr:dTDP-4-dehydrorhamnose reductase [candidate division Zixibacteria bacterium]
MPSKILVTGAAGLLGSDLTAYFSEKYDVYPAGREDFDIRDFAAADRIFTKFEPDIVLHAAALADVDKCEADEELAYGVNAAGTENVARLCHDYRVRMIYYSTDYVFDGNSSRPYTENDPTNPINIYGRSKLEGETRVLSLLDGAVVLRIAWLYSTGKRAFINKLIMTGRKYMDEKKARKNPDPIKVAADQIGSPTWTMEIARQTEVVIKNNLKGIFHCAAGGECSRYEMARILFEHLGGDVALSGCTRSDFPWRAPRPEFTSLENRNLEKLGLNIMKNYREALKEFLNRRGGDRGD